MFMNVYVCVVKLLIRRPKEKSEKKKGNVNYETALIGLLTTL